MARRADGHVGWPLLLALLAAPAAAQKVSADASLGTQMLWTSNANFGTGKAERDAVLDLRPSVTLRADGARLQLAGTVGAVASVHSNQEQQDGSRVLPQVDMNARLEAIERLLFVEAGYRAVQASEDAFGPRSEGSSTSNRFTATQWRLTPYIQGQAGTDLRYSLRSENSWSGQLGASAGSTVGTAAGYFGRHSASIEQEPRPLGWRVEAESARTRYDSGSQDPVSTDVARAILRYALGADIVAGLRIGSERDSFLVQDKRRNLYGLEATWRPSQRTTLSASAEHRFFGSGWRLAFDHRQPQLAWNLGLSRSIDTAPQSLFELPAGDVARLLDAMFTTRYPDPVERARLVRELIASRGLPTTTLEPSTLFSQRLSLVTARSASVAFIGVRSTLALSAFNTLTRDVPESGLLATGSTLNNNVQRGGAVVFEHRLTALTGINTRLDWTRIRAVGEGAQDQTTQYGLDTRLNMQLGPRTNAYLGGRFRKLESNVVTEGREGAVYLGVDHRF